MSHSANNHSNSEKKIKKLSLTLIKLSGYKKMRIVYISNKSEFTYCNRSPQGAGRLTTSLSVLVFK